MNAFPKQFGMVTNSVFIYRERNTIISINLSVMLDEMATRILSDIIYPSFIISFAPYLILCPCQRFVNAKRIMTGTLICSKVNNLCHILFFLPSPFYRRGWLVNLLQLPNLPQIHQMKKEPKNQHDHQD